MERLKFLITDLNSNKNSKKKFSHTFSFFNDELLNKTIFTYFNVFDEQNDLEKFISIVKLSNYVYNNKIDKTPNEISKDCISKIKTIFDNGIQQEVSRLLFSDLCQTLTSFREMEFISLAFFLNHTLKDSDIKFKKLEKKDLKSRIWELLDNIDQKKNYDFKTIFKPSKKIDVYSHFNGRFESGIKNIFLGEIPNDMNEKELHNTIVKFKKEIKHLKHF